MPYGLKIRDVERIKEVLSRHPAVNQAILYGSRALGTHRKGSDIDLTFTGQGLDLRTLSCIETELDDLLLPYQFDTSLFRQIDNAELRNHIERVGKVFYQRGEAKNASCWSTIPFAEILTEQPRNGWSPPAANHSPSGVPVLTLSSVTHFRFNGTKVKYTTAPTKKDAHYWLREGELLISRSNTAELVGHAAIYDGTPSPGICCDLIMKMRVDDGRASTRFIHYYLQSETARDYLKARAGGASATMQKINKSIVQELPVPVPPLPEQERIVAILDEAFEGIATATAHAERNLHNARELFQSVLQSTFQQKGEDWVETTLRDVCGITSKLADPREEEFIDLLHVGGANIASNTGELLDLKTAREEQLISGKFPFDSSMVLYSKIRPYLMKVARPDIEGLCSADIYPLAPQEDVLDRDFLFHLLLTSGFTDYAILGSGRAGMPKVNRTHLFAYEFSIPPLSIQKSIVQKLDALATETRRLEAVYERKLAALAELKQSLLQRAFAGEL